MFDELYIIASFIPIHHHIGLGINHPALMTIEMYAYDGDAIERMPSRALEILSSIPTLEKDDVIPCSMALTRLFSSSYKMGVFSWAAYDTFTFSHKYWSVIVKIKPDIELFQKNWLMGKSNLYETIPIPDEFPADHRIVDVIRNNKPCADKVIDVLFDMNVDHVRCIIDSRPREMKEIAKHVVNKKKMIELADRIQRRGWYSSSR